MSIAVISSRMIDQAGIENFMDYALKVPNLSFSFSNGQGVRESRSIAIRGTEGAGTTGFYIDDLPPLDGVVHDVYLDTRGALELTIGAGTRSSDHPHLDRALADVFESHQTGDAAIFVMEGIVRFDRIGPRIISLTYSTNDVRGLALRRLEPVESPAHGQRRELMH